MPINSRAKGAAGEREFLKAVHERTGIKGSRNLEQTRSGGHDVNGLPGWAPEVKRREVLDVAGWWQQALDQAKIANKKPVLAYRQNRKPWRVVILLSEISPAFAGSDATCTISIDTYCSILKEA